MYGIYPSLSLKLFDSPNAHTTASMAPLGIVTPGFHFVVCSDVRLIIIKIFLPRACKLSQAQVVLYKTGPLIVSRVFLTEFMMNKISFALTEPGDSPEQ